MNVAEVARAARNVATALDREVNQRVEDKAGGVVTVEVLDAIADTLRMIATELDGTPTAVETPTTDPWGPSPSAEGVTPW